MVSAPITGALHERHPAEVPVISRLFGVPNAHKLEVYLQNDGYKGWSGRSRNFRPSK